MPGRGVSFIWHRVGRFFWFALIVRLVLVVGCLGLGIGRERLFFGLVWLWLAVGFGLMLLYCVVLGAIGAVGGVCLIVGEDCIGWVI